MTEPRTSEVLNTAADLIERDGWTKGIKGMNAAAGDPHCLLGAIGADIGADTFIGSGGVERYTYFDTQNCSAAYAVGAYLNFGDSPDEWNDHPGRKASEVIEVLRAAALVEAAREDAALLAEVGRA